MLVAQAPLSHQYFNCPACQWRASCERVPGVKRTHPSSSRGDTAMLRPAFTAALKQTPMAFWKFSMSSFVAGGHTCGGAAATSVMGRFGSGRLLSVLLEACPTWDGLRLARASSCRAVRR